MKIVNGILALLFSPLIVVGYVLYIGYAAFIVGWARAQAAQDARDRTS